MDAKSYAKVLEDTFIKDYHDVGKEEADAQIVKANIRVSEIKQAMKDDETLRSAKEYVKELSEPYKDAVKREETKIKFFIERLQELKDGAGD